ncbi:MAG: S1C family serine protease [Blastocatellia bacterium]
MRFITGLVSMLIIAGPLAGSAAQAQNKTPKEIAREISRAVVIIEALDDRGSVTGQGSGFIVTSNGAIVSNLHVVRGAAMARIKLPNGDVYKTADVVESDDAKDIVILKVKGFRLPVVNLGDSDKTEVGESTVAISSPEGLANSVSTGVISGVRRLDTHRVFQITAPISQGSSGGALFNSNGEVIGIVTYFFKSGQNINFAVPINYARGMIGDQITTTLAKLGLAPTARDEAAAAPSLVESTDTPESTEGLDGMLANANRAKLGRTPQDPMFLRPDQALAFMLRLVGGIGLFSSVEVADLTRTAAVIKSAEAPDSEQYTIKYLSFYSGLSITFSKPDRLLTGVELLVTWSEDDLKSTFGEKFKRRTLDGRKILDYGTLKLENSALNGKQLIAIPDGNGNIRAVRITKGK